MGQALAGGTPVLLAVAPSAPCPLRTKEHLLCPGKKVVLGPKLAELSPVSVSLALEPPQLLVLCVRNNVQDWEGHVAAWGRQ